MEPTSSESFAVQIRSPSLNETLTIATKRSDSIRDLKLLIHGIHPRKPHAHDQRIIFGGRVLDDSEMLGQILERADASNTPTLHLVVKPSLVHDSAGSTSSTADTARSTASSLTSQQPSASFSAPSFFSTTQPYPPQQQQQQPTQPQTAPEYPPLLPGGYQVVALNGQYYLAPVLVPRMNPPVLGSQPAATAYGQSNAIPPTIGGNNPAPPQQQQAPARARINNAQRAASVWLALKLIFILFIICQDASIERILFFHAIAFVFFLYQTGRLRFVQVRPEDLHRNMGGIGAQPPQQQQQPRTPADPAPTEARGTTGGGDANNQNNGLRQRRSEHTQPQQPTTTEEQPPQQPATLLATLKRGAYTFIASLWPNYGHDARIAQALDNGQQEAWEGF